MLNYNLNRSDHDHVAENKDKCCEDKKNAAWKSCVKLIEKLNP